MGGGLGSVEYNAGQLELAGVNAQTIAGAMNKSLIKGSLYSLDTLLTRVYGKPKEQYDIQQDTKIEVVFVEGKTIL